MYYGFVYEWTNLVNGKKYIGSHAGTENDGYIGSGVAFKKQLLNTVCLTLPAKF